MGNTLTNILPVITARALRVLREQCVMPRLVLTDIKLDPAVKGTKIPFEVPATAVQYAVSPAATPVTPANLTPGVRNLDLDQWYARNFHLSDNDLTKIEADKAFIPMQMQDAINVLANGVNSHIFSKYKGVYGYVGTAGTTPFATNANAITAARKVLLKQACPNEPDNMRCVLDLVAEEQGLNLPPFADASQGDASVKIRGQLGQKYGFGFFSDNSVPTHTAGTAAGVVTAGALAAAKTSLTSTLVLTDAGGALALLEGDIITIAGDTQTYVVTADAAGAGATNVIVAPGLQIALLGGDVVTIKADHVVNLAFHRNAFAFAQRQGSWRQVGAVGGLEHLQAGQAEVVAGGIEADLPGLAWRVAAAFRLPE